MCMIGIPVDLPTYIFGDNQYVLVNTSKHHSTLKREVGVNYLYQYAIESC